MNNASAISGNNRNRIITTALVFIGVCLISATALRISLLFVYPLLAIAIVAFYRLKISPSLFALLSIVTVGFVFSFFNGIFLKYKLLSLYYMLPFLVLLFADFPSRISRDIKHLPLFIKCLSAVVLLNDLVGFIQLYRDPQSDDSFEGIYSAFSVGVNGLSLINIFLAFFYAVSFAYKRRLWHLPAAIFFFVCGVLGFYGGGLIVCTIAFVGSFFVFDLGKIFKVLSITIISLASLYLLARFAKPQIIDYNIANIKKMASLDIHSGPRKIKSFYNYGISYPKDIKDFTLGSGPGTFNSRTAFMVGSPYYFSGFPLIKDENKPYYFDNFAYTLWNEKNTIQSQYLDGFRNQPFSSILAFLGEYGLIFTVAFFLFYIIYYQKIAAIYRSVKKDSDARLYFRFFKFLIILLPLLLLIDNYYENPEIMLIMLLGIKLAHYGLIQTREANQTAT